MIPIIIDVRVKSYRVFVRWLVSLYFKRTSYSPVVSETTELLLVSAGGGLLTVMVDADSAFESITMADILASNFAV